MAVSPIPPKLKLTMQARGWLWFGAWALEGGLLAFSALSAASVGLFVMPVALLVLVLLARAGAAGPQILGALTGAGAPTLVVAWLEEGPGGLDARPWLAAGLVLVAAGLGGYLAARRRTQPPSAVV
jgi:hypothetical protein